VHVTTFGENESLQGEQYRVEREIGDEVLILHGEQPGE